MKAQNINKNVILETRKITHQSYRKVRAFRQGTISSNPNTNIEPTKLIKPNYRKMILNFILGKNERKTTNFPAYKNVQVIK